MNINKLLTTADKLLTHESVISVCKQDGRIAEATVMQHITDELSWDFTYSIRDLDLENPEKFLDFYAAVKDYVLKENN
ncbi:hypothetical protein [Salmonella phage SSBI34]|nr:hypothetical protein [Salmonella phage SSBI34]